MKKILKGAIAAAIILTATSVFALDKPQGRTILTVKGNIAETNSEHGAEFDLAMLEGLEGREGTMETPWTEGQVTFSGPFLRSVLEAAGAKGKNLKVIALNDYAADIPTDDAKLDTILAVRMNGEEMPIRDKGPVFLVYPFDLDGKLYNEKYFARSVWQIKTIEVLD